MNRKMAGAVVVVALLTAGCSSGEDAATPAPDPTPSTTTSMAPTSDPTPEPTTEAAQEPEEETHAPVAYDDYTVATEAREGGFPAAIQTYGADQVFAAVVRNDAAITVGAASIPQDVLVQSAVDSCALLDQGMTFDEVFMDAAVDMPQDNEANDFGNFAWSIILTAVDTHCPQHVEARDAWYASGH